MSNEVYVEPASQVFVRGYACGAVLHDGQEVSSERAVVLSTGLITFAVEGSREDLRRFAEQINQIANGA